MNYENYQFLMASPSYFTGTSSGGDIKLDHVFGNIFNYENDSISFNEAYHMASFKMPEHEKKIGMSMPNYYPVGEICSQLLSVFYGTLVIPLGFFKSNNAYCLPNYTDLKKYRYDLPFYSDQARFEFPVEQCRGIIKNLTLKKLDQTFITASRLYQNALIDYVNDTSFAYTSLVGAGEILSSEMAVDEAKLYDEDTLKLIEEIKEKLEKGKGKAKLIKSRLHQIKRKYVHGLIQYFDDRIISNNENVYAKMNFDNIESALKASYDLRSMFLHNGFRMGMHTKNLPLEIGLSHSTGYSSGLKKILGKAPTFVALERFIRYCLLKKLFNLIERDFYIPCVDNPLDFEPS